MDLVNFLLSHGTKILMVRASFVGKSSLAAGKVGTWRTKAETITRCCICASSLRMESLINGLGQKLSYISATPSPWKIVFVVLKWT